MRGRGVLGRWAIGFGLGAIALVADRPAPVEGQAKPPPIKIPGKASTSTSVDLSGVWSSDDGGTYCVRQVAGQLDWYGESPDGGKSWSNVFHADLKAHGGKVATGEKVGGTWADVPKGGSRNSGILFLTTESADRFAVKEGLGREGFTGTAWTRVR
jgi:hypothetical protein